MHWSSRLMRIGIVFGLLAASTACNFSNRMKPTPEWTPESVTPTDPVQQVEHVTESPSHLETLPATPEIGGLKVAYTSENDLFIWNGGSVRRLTKSGDVHEPRISPDGELVAFLRTADAFHTELWVIDVDGNRETRLVNVADLDAIGGGVRDPAALAINPYRYRWVPGTSLIAFNTYQVFQGPGLNLLNDLNLVGADFSGINHLFLSGWGGEFCFSPDGKQVAISQPDKILLAGRDGSNYRTVLTYDPVITYSDYRYYAMPVWSGDSSYFLVAIPPADPLAQPVQFTEVWKVFSDGSAPEMLGRVETVHFREQPVSFSPDLKRIAYLREVGEPAENLRELTLATADGQGVFVYAKASPVVFQGWSPDSVHFLYSVGLEPETWIGSIQEAPRVLDPRFNGAQGFRWVSAEQFIFWIPIGDGFELYLATSDGGLSQIDTIFTDRPFFTYAP